MKPCFPVLLVLWLAGCTFTRDVNRRQPGQDWYYYGGLLDYYRDQTQGTPVSLVWLEEVQTVEVKRDVFPQTVRAFLAQGYRPIGQIAVESAEPIYPETLRRIAAQKGAQVVISYVTSGKIVAGERPVIDREGRTHLGQAVYDFRFERGPWLKRSYFFQFLGK